MTTYVIEAACLGAAAAWFAVQLRHIINIPMENYHEAEDQEYRFQRQRGGSDDSDYAGNG